MNKEILEDLSWRKMLWLRRSMILVNKGILEDRWTSCYWFLMRTMLLDNCGMGVVSSYHMV